MQILGSPVGSAQFIHRECLKFARKQQPFLQKLRCIANTQVASLLLRYCGVPTLTHLLRSIPPPDIESAAKLHDENIVSTWESIIGINVSPDQSQQLSLPLSHGGFGLSSASLVSPCAFIGSWAASLAFLPGCIEKFPSAPTNIDTTPSERFLEGHIFRAIIGLHPVGEDIKSLIPNAEQLPNWKPKLQAKLTQILQSDAAERLISRSDQRSQARIRSASGSESAAWLDALPSSNALSFSLAEFRIAALLRLGAEIPFLRDIDHCDCGATIDNEGYHTLTCARGLGAVRRHNAIQHTWLNLLHSVNYVCDLEREHQFDDDNKRPDIGVFNFKDGRKLLLDVSVIHPQSGSVLARSARSDGAAAAKRDEDKLANTSTTQRDSDISSSRSFLADGVPSQDVYSPNFPFALL